MFRRFLLIASSLPLAAACAEKLDFNRDIRPILSEKCYHCHGPDEGSRKAKLRLDVRAEAVKARDGVKAIVPGDVTASELVLRITSSDPDEVMPPPKEHHELTDAERAKLKTWIAEGAEYAPHWAFVAPTWKAEGAAEKVPGFEKWARSPIDGFILDRLRREGLTPSPEADPHTLCRRLHLDLTGLPPTPEEVETFVEAAMHNRQAAVEALVDRLLASPAYGERWAKMWLDLARFADSTGYGSDKFRLNIWPWRDWVIDAFNRNLPYDQFTIEQLAGDLLPNATPQQVAATAFHRNTMTNVEGGTDDEEYRVAAVKDRVATTMQVWMGLTAQCAQCHSHKFDPISHHEYYSLFAIFNQTKDADREDEAPRLPVPTAHEAEQRTRLQSELETLNAKAKVVSPEFETEMHEWEAALAAPVSWSPLTIDSATTREGTLALQADGSLLAPAALADAEKYMVKAKAPAGRVTALRVEVLPVSEGKAIGHAGNAVLTEFQATAAPPANKPVRGRFVRIAHAKREFLQIAEVEVFSGGNNVAPQGKAKQSSTYSSAQAQRAVDGNTDGIYERNSVAHTADGDAAPWWEVDLGAEIEVEKIAVWNRAEAPERIAGAALALLDAQRRPVFSRVLETMRPSAEFDPHAGVNLEFAAASADFAQDGWEVGKAIDGDSKTGWDFAPAITEPHVAIFALKTPLDLAAETQLTVTLRQDFGQRHNLARFRLSTTDAMPPPKILPAEIKATLALEPTERSAEQREALAEYFRPFSKTQAALQAEITAKRDALAKIKPIELPILRERAADQRRTTWLLNKGNFLLRGDVVQAGLPAAFEPAAPGEVDRLALARWLVSRDNPLTARVTVNRFWAQLFGTGLVETEEDFGTQGQLPSHPELLDWLALEFMEKHWDVKALLRQIVTSATYRQSSQIQPEHLQKDPRNRLLAHYPRRRLGAEEVRDQALHLSGLFSAKIGGPSVYPPQPAGLWNVAFNGGQNGYPTSTGEDRYRRALYTFWRRTMPNPTMSTFDAPSRETCTLRRSPTNTPLQAFVTLNDPVFVECAQALARRILQADVCACAQDGHLHYALELVLGRPASETEIETLRALLEQTREDFRNDPTAAMKLATDPLGPLPTELDPIEAAAWTVIANVLLNLDAVLTRS